MSPSPGCDEDGGTARADVVFHDELAAETGHGGDVLDGVKSLVVVDVAGVVADADGRRLEAVVQFAEGGAVLADAGVGLWQEQNAGVFGGADAGFEGGVEAVNFGLPGRASFWGGPGIRRGRIRRVPSRRGWGRRLRRRVRWP